MSSELSHWYIDATVYRDRVEEVHYISDPVQNIRRRRQTRVWKVEQLLGHGSFGQVRLERNQEDGRVRVVKRMTITSATLSNSECEKELKALLEFSKPKFKEAAVFVEFFGWFKDGYDIFLAMEYVHLGDLHKNVVAISGKIPENEARDIAEQLLLGLEIMHAESFAHRDLKPQNVLVIHGPPQWWVKLADFGLSKRLTNTTGYNTRAGTQSYMAPEILDFLNPYEPGLDYTDAVDIWSTGCIVYRLITGVVPFPLSTSLLKYCEDKSLFPYDALFDSGIKSEGSRFLRQLLVAKPSARPSATQALKHKWILSGSSIERMPPKTMSSEPLLEENSGLLNLSSSEVGYNTASHAGLQPDPSLPSSSSQTVLPPPSAPKISPPSNHTTIGPYRIRPAPPVPQPAPPLPPSSSQPVLPPPSAPKISPPSNHTTIGPYQIRPAPTYAQPSVSQPVPQSKQPQSAALTEKTPAAAFNPETQPTAEPRSSKAINILFNSSTASNPSKRRQRSSFFGMLNTKLSTKQVLSPDGELVASPSGNKTAVQLWDSTTGARRITLKGHTSQVLSVAFSLDSKLVASGSYDKTVRLWDLATGAACSTLEGHTNYVYSVAFSPDGKLVALGSYDMTVQLLDLATGTRRSTLEGHTSYVYSVAFSLDSKLVASGSYDKTVRLWDSATGATRSTLKGHTSRVYSVAFSPDGKLVASGSYDKTIRLWNLATGAVYSTLKGHTSSVLSVAFSPDSKLVASGSDDKTVRLWDSATGAARGTLTDHTSFVLSVAFSPDGKLVASGSGDMTIRLWNLATRAVYSTLEGHTSYVYSVAFSPDSKLVASGSYDMTVRLWELE